MGLVEHAGLRNRPRSIREPSPGGAPAATDRLSQPLSVALACPLD
ncbi:hypothetical protein SF06_33950 [Pseudomonas flexibilis]|nr:hypothetical protein SF06_33950 [Pseudomonas flexibilis]